MHVSSWQSKYVARGDIEPTAGRQERLHVRSRIAGSWDCQILGPGNAEYLGLGLRAKAAGLWDLMLETPNGYKSTLQLTRFIDGQHDEQPDEGLGNMC